MGFDGLQGHRGFQGRDRFQIDHHPAWILGGGIGIGLPGHSGDALDLFFGDAVVKQDQVPLFHGLEVVSGLIIANSVPIGFLIRHKLFPVVFCGFLLD